MASIECDKEGEAIEINMTDEERVIYLTKYAKEHYAPESFQVFLDVLEDQKGIEIAFAQGAINEVVIEALHNAIRIEEAEEKDGTE